MMIPAQRHVLQQFIQDQLEVIDEFNSISPAIKTLYLKRSISCALKDFLEFLDKLYDGNNLELIRTLKNIHDMAFNHIVRSDERELLIWELWFRSLIGSGEIPSCRDEVNRLVNKKIGEISKQVSNIEFLEQDRRNKEVNIAPNSHWRALLKLPDKQLPFPIRSYLQCHDLSLAQLSNLTEQQWKNLSNYQIFQIVIVPENHFSLEQAKNLSETHRQEIVKRFLNNEPFQLPTTLETLRNSLFDFFERVSGHEENHAPGSPAFNPGNGMS